MEETVPPPETPAANAQPEGGAGPCPAAGSQAAPGGAESPAQAEGLPHTEEPAAPEGLPGRQAAPGGGESPAQAGDLPYTEESVTPEDLLGAPAEPVHAASAEDQQLKALLEAIVYVTEDPLTLEQIAAATGEPKDRVARLLDELTAEFDRPEHGVTIRQVAGGYKMATKAEHHEAVRNFVKSLKPPLKLSLAALETLAVIAYKQPITAPEIMEIRGVQGAGVLKTLLDRKLIAAAGRKNVIGKPILYKTTKEFLVQFGLKDLTELPSLKEFEEIRRMAIADEPLVGPVDGAPAEPAPAPETQSETPNA